MKGLFDWLGALFVISLIGNAIRYLVVNFIADMGWLQ